MIRLLLNTFLWQTAWALFLLSMIFGIGEWVSPGLGTTLFPVWLLPVAALFITFIAVALEEKYCV